MGCLPREFALAGDGHAHRPVSPRQPYEAADMACVHLTPAETTPTGSVRERSVPYTQVRLGWSGVLPTRVVKLAGCLREAFGGSRCRPGHGPRSNISSVVTARIHGQNQ